MKQHKPPARGSWEYDQTDYNVYDSGTLLVATLMETNKGYGELIAAAPDLLSALEYMLIEQEREGFGDEMPDIKQAREAIAKAKGEA